MFSNDYGRESQLVRLTDERINANNTKPKYVFWTCSQEMNMRIHIQRCAMVVYQDIEARVD